MDQINSTSNPLIKQARSLRQRKGRVESGLFLVEGIHHVGEVVEAGWAIETILYAPDILTSTFANELLERLRGSGHQLREVSVKVMESLADKENPQGILAIVNQKHARLEEIGSIRRGVALVTPQDPGNVGTILRTMDATGADILFLLDGGVELFHPTLVRASMGSLFWKPTMQLGFSDFIAQARLGGFQLIATSSHSSVDYREFTPRLPSILVFGSEQKGLSADQTASCDVTISVPMRGRVSSLNLAVAAGVLLYQFADTPR